VQRGQRVASYQSYGFVKIKINKVSMIAHFCNPGYLGGRGSRITVQDWPGQKHKTLPEKQTKSKRSMGVAQVIEPLHSKHKALSPLPSITNINYYYYIMQHNNKMKEYTERKKMLGYAWI
jgi:hypothetical protein